MEDNGGKVPQYKKGAAPNGEDYQSGQKKGGGLDEFWNGAEGSLGNTVRKMPLTFGEEKGSDDNKTGLV